MAAMDGWEGAERGQGSAAEEEGDVEEAAEPAVVAGGAVLPSGGLWTAAEEGCFVTAVTVAVLRDVMRTLRAVLEPGRARRVVFEEEARLRQQRPH